MTETPEAAIRAREARAVAHRAVTEGVNLRYVEKLRQEVYALADDYDALVAENARLTAELAEAKNAPYPFGRALVVLHERDEALRVAAELRGILRRVLDGEPWGTFSPDGSGATLEDAARAALSSEGQPRDE